MDYSNHLLRASFVTVAKRKGADDSQIMQQTKHRTRTTVDRYTRVQKVEEYKAANLNSPTVSKRAVLHDKKRLF